VLAVFGRGLPRRVRSFLLALAILDDIVAIGFIAVLFTADLETGMLLAGLAGAVAFGALSLLLRTRVRLAAALAMALVAGLTWWLVLQSGVHPTIAGVALGLAMSRPPAGRARHALEPWTNLERSSPCSRSRPPSCRSRRSGSANSRRRSGASRSPSRAES
jgi:NhaA family Na+:H+ antiporter